ncbi:HNH endonuclease [Blastococcus sp. TF02-09]|uniref:HNH endonuclease signature motif containing protein n=1 Tax=Blastococcus sp. TF02-09 TaxID=2250576 RepID=UPI000E14760B|nr:HNH endonuclease signature motif containing protein [Blastococcus sp. TF02-9]RBY79245.1 HNH endonuclease [Blastococcus sp. TF02-9]
MEEGGTVGPPVDGEPMPFVPSELGSAYDTDLELVADIWSSDAHMAREYARQAAAVAELARRRTVEWDADFGSRGAPGVDSRAMRPPALADVSDDFVSELAVIRHCSEDEASRLAAESVLLTTTLAPTWSELFAGRLTIRKARILLDLLGDASDAVAAAVQARVLPGAEDCPPSRLGDRVRYHLYRVDAAAKERRRREAERRADVHVERTADGLGRLVIEGPLPVVHAARDAVAQYARWLRAEGDDRPMGVLRSTTALDLLLRPWDTSRPAVTAHLTIHAALPALRADAPSGAAPAEVDGQLVSAMQCRELLASLDLLGLGTPPAGGSVSIAIDDPASGETVAVATRTELRRAAGPGGSGLGRPPPTGSYEPSAAQRRLVTVRDRRCRMPGCGRRAGTCDIDHGHPYADGGPTACENLCCLCRRHHRIKTFARGWSFALGVDGRLTVHTPSGVSRTTRPPGWYHDPEPDPPELEELAPPDPLRP